MKEMEEECEDSYHSGRYHTSCPAQLGSQPSDTTSIQLCHPCLFLTDTSLFRNWVFTTISMDLPCLQLSHCLGHKKYFKKMYSNSFHMSWWNTAVRCSPLSLLCTGPEALKNSSNDRSADMEIKYNHLKIWHNCYLSKPQRLYPVSELLAGDFRYDI